jgi:hypothetical protein
MATVDSSGFVLPSNAVGLRPLAGLVARDAPFYSVVSRDVVPDGSWRGFTFHFRPGISEQERIKIAAQVLDVDQSAFSAIAHTQHRLPALRIGHGAWVEAIARLLHRLPIALVGNYFGGISLEDCAERALQQATRLSAKRH